MFTWAWIKNCPLRKLLAVIATVAWIAVVAIMLKYREDIPNNVHNLLIGMCGAIYGGYFSTSTIEHVKNLKKEPTPEPIAPAIEEE